MNKKNSLHLFVASTFLTAVFGLGVSSSQAGEKAQLTTAPQVPPPITRSSSTTVEVNFEVKEYEGDLADGVKYKFWGFGGTVPGPMVRVRVGDVVEFHLANHKSSSQPHNIDIHAVNGPGGVSRGIGRLPSASRKTTLSYGESL